MDYETKETRDIPGMGSMMLGRLGGGCYSEAWHDLKYPKRVFIFSETGGSRDRSKEVLAYARSLRKSPHLPYLRYLGTWVNPRSGFASEVWETRYSKGTSSYQPEYVDSREASVISDSVRFDSSLPDIIKAVKQDSEVPPGVKEALKDLLKAVRHFKLDNGDGAGSYSLDMHLGNFGVDAKGRLILRDPMVAFF
jgi:hypothetical protein